MSISNGSIHTFEVPDPLATLSKDPEGKNNRTEIAIVGAGPCGLLTACLLQMKKNNLLGQAKESNKGCQGMNDIKVFDFRRRPTSFFGSFPIALNKRGLTALKQLGPEFIAKVEKSGRPINAQNILSGPEKTAASIECYGITIMRDQLVGLLLEVADGLGIPIYWNHKFLSLDIERRHAVFERLEQKEEIAVPIEGVLIGADGNFSRVRRECERKHNLLTVQDWDWSTKMRQLIIPTPDPKPSTSTAVDDNQHYSLGEDGYLMKQPNEYWSMTLGVDDVPGRDFMKSNDPSPENIAKLKAFITSKESPASFFAEHLSIDDESYASFFKRNIFSGSIIKCSTLAPTDWIALIGDAAHAVAPYTGEGVNSSLESAFVLVSTTLNSYGTNTTDNQSRSYSCKEYDEARKGDAYALNYYALRVRENLRGTPSQRFVFIFGTIILTIGKKIGIIKSTPEDYMLGAKAKEIDTPLSYTELMNMDKRQRRVLDVIGYVFYHFVQFIVLPFNYMKK